ncbi:hypothetical protein [Hydrogenovibrio kuenenii]|uniref:hypothetical protein n=1 Tax=Hydrogenovibrio kuenenii TaxID=63658 RepID=UPI0004632418|nr:hypothetical protein [Hydrogenovibrio kuenenii]
MRLNSNLFSSYANLIKFSVLAVAILLETGCASTLTTKHLEPFKADTPTSKTYESAVQVNPVTVQINTGAVKPSEKEVTKALQNVFHEYGLDSKGLPKYRITTHLTVKLTGFMNNHAKCTGQYIIQNINTSEAKTINITSNYTSHITNKMMTQEMISGAEGVVIGGTVGHAIGGSGSTTVGAMAGGVIASSTVREKADVSKDVTKYHQESGTHKYTAAELAILERSGYAKPGTPLSAWDGMARLKLTVEGAIRSNFFKLIQEMDKS